jgi:hypothetical protein
MAQEGDNTATVDTIEYGFVSTLLGLTCTDVYTFTDLGANSIYVLLRRNI